MKFKEGELYNIYFWDHCVGIDAPVKFNCVGWVYKDDPLYVVTTHWKIDEDCGDLDLVDSSREPSTIIKSTIISVKKL